MLTQLSTVKSRLAIAPADTSNDAILTAAIKAVSARFDQECNRTLARTEAATHEFDPADTEILPACYAVTPDGTVTNADQSFDIDTLLLAPADQDLYCLVFRSSESILLRLPRFLMTHQVGQVVAMQSGETGTDPAVIFFRWNGTTFGSRRLFLRDYFLQTDFFEKACFAPITLPKLIP